MPRIYAFPVSVLLAALVLVGCAHAPASDSTPPAAPVVVDAPPADDALPAADDVANEATFAEPVAATEPTPANEASDGAAPDATTNDPRSDAELEYDALYGSQDGSSDAGLPAPAELEQSYDPWEGFNRRMHSFNNVVDRVIAKPLAKFYIAVTPRPGLPGG